MSSKPFFSIVLPTLNRANYISLAIQSVLNQTFTDFELIVSDNSSTDDTEDRIKKFSDKRLHYVKTERKLPMYDSWEFALDHATGEYITFLGDDDAYSSIYLESLKKVIEQNNSEILSCKMADYYHHEYAGVKINSLITNSFSNNLFKYDSRQIIKDIFIEQGLCKESSLHKFQIPQLINTVYHNSIFTKVKKRFGRVFPNTLSGDFYLAIGTLNFTDNYHFLDAPLSFHGISSESTTSSITDTKKGSNIKDTQPELALLSKVPFEFSNPYNFVVDALMLVKDELGDDLNYFELDLTGYFIKIYYYHIHNMELAGIDTSEAMSEFNTVVGKQDLSIQEEIKSTISNTETVIKDRLRLKFNDSNLYKFLRSLSSLINHKTVIIDGKKHGFNNIVECGNFVEYDFLEKYRKKEKKSNG